MILKSKRGAKLANAVTDQADADFAVGDRLPVLRRTGIGGGFFEALDRLLGRRAYLLKGETGRTNKSAGAEYKISTGDVIAIGTFVRRA